MPKTISAIALFDYEKVDQDEISFLTGDEISITNKSNDDWFEGRRVGPETRIGYFPANRVQIIEDIATPTTVPSIPTISSSSIVVTKASIAATPTTTYSATSFLPSSLDQQQYISSSQHSNLPPLAPLRSESPQTQTSLLDTPNLELITLNERVSEVPELPPPDFDLDRIPQIPPDQIRKQGILSFKARNTPNASSWKNMWCILITGWLIIYKEQPTTATSASNTKKSPKLFLTLDQSHTLESTGKADSKRKSVFSIWKVGVLWMFQASDAADLGSWMEAIAEASWERNSAKDVESVRVLLFGNVGSMNATVDDKGDTTALEIGTRSSESGGKHSKKAKIGRQRSASGGDPDSSNAPLSDDKRVSGKLGKKIGSFFGRGKIGSKERVTDAGLPVFGSILDLVTQNGSNIPEIIRDCVQAIEARGLSVEGIYRLSGNAATIQKLKSKYDSHEIVDLLDEALDINAVASLLKLYLRELPTPLFPLDMYEEFMTAVDVEDYNTKLILIKTLIQRIPPTIYELLNYLFAHLQRVFDNSSVNKMESANIGIVFGPTIVKMPEGVNEIMVMSGHNKLIDAILVQTDWIFDGNPN